MGKPRDLNNPRGARTPPNQKASREDMTAREEKTKCIKTLKRAKNKMQHRRTRDREETPTPEDTWGGPFL